MHKGARICLFQWGNRDGELNRGGFCRRGLEQQQQQHWNLSGYIFQYMGGCSNSAGISLSLSESKLEIDFAPVVLKCSGWKNGGCNALLKLASLLGEGFPLILGEYI